MKYYKKQIDNETVIKTLQEIVIKKNGKQIINPKEEMVIEDGWEEYTYTKPKKTLSVLKQEKIDEIKQYDESSEINTFFIQDYPVWFDKSTRSGLKLRFESEIATGKEETTLWHDNLQFPLKLQDAIQMLYSIEVYASQCYDNTHYHIANVNKLTTITAVKSYDYMTGYPEKLKF